MPAKEDIQHERLAEWMCAFGATVTHLTPAMVNLLMIQTSDSTNLARWKGQILVGGASTIFPSLRNAFFVGDQLLRRDCRILQALAPNCRIVRLAAPILALDSVEPRLRRVTDKHVRYDRVERLLSLTIDKGCKGTTETQRAVSYCALPPWNEDSEYLRRMPDVIPAGTSPNSSSGRRRNKCLRGSRQRYEECTIARCQSYITGPRQASPMRHR